MKFRYLFVIWVLVLFPLMGLAQGGELDKFKEIHLTMNELDAEVLYRKEPHDKSSFPVKVDLGGEMSGMPARVSVKGSFTRNFLKKSLLIKFDKGNNWHGHRKIALNSMVTDYSKLREWLAWDLIHKLGMVSPAVEYFKVFINNEYVGLYLFIEWIDETLFSKLGMERGQFFHPIDREFCGDLDIKNLAKTNVCWLKLFPSGNDFSALEQLIKQIEQTDAEQFDAFLLENFEIDSVVNWLVVNTITSNGDTYNKNYFLFLDNKTSKWSVVPWDYDLSFGRNADPVYLFPKNILNDNFQYYYPPNLGNDSPLKKKFFKNTRLYSLFQQRLSDVMGLSNINRAKESSGWFKPDNFSTLVDDVKAQVSAGLIGSLYDADPNGRFAEHVESLKFYNLMRYHLLKQLVLEPTVFNTWHWMPYISYPVIKQGADAATNINTNGIVHQPLLLSDIQLVNLGQRVVVPIDDQYSRPLGVLWVEKIVDPLRIRMSVETEHAPKVLPHFFRAEQCIQRDWYIDVLTTGVGLTANITLDYIQESSIHHELGQQLSNEKQLQLWLQVDDEWQKLNVKVNSYANTLHVESLTLLAGKVYHFVACQAGPKQ